MKNSERTSKQRDDVGYLTCYNDEIHADIADVIQTCYCSSVQQMDSSECPVDPVAGHSA